MAAGILTLDIETANVFEVTLTDDVATLVLANPPAAGSASSATLILKQDATGGRTLAWPGSVKWPGGAPPAVTAAANAIEGDATDERGSQDATFTGSPELNVDSILDLDTITEDAPVDGKCIAWPGIAGVYARRSITPPTRRPKAR